MDREGREHIVRQVQFHNASESRKLLEKAGESFQGSMRKTEIFRRGTFDARVNGVIGSNDPFGRGPFGQEFKGRWELNGI